MFQKRWDDGRNSSEACSQQVRSALLTGYKKTGDESPAANLAYGAMHRPFPVF